MNTTRLIASVIAITFAGPAVASEVTWRNDTRLIVRVPYEQPNARIIQVPQHAIDEDRDARWRAACKPYTVTDQLGVERYRYAAAGCEYGKIPGQ